MQLTEKHKVPLLKTPIRLQEYGVGIFASLPTKSAFKKAIKKKRVFVNNKVATTAFLIQGNEIIELFEQEEKTPKKQFNLNLEILFEDDYLALIYKPAGILVSGNSFATIDNTLSQNLEQSNLSTVTRPRPVHRLDYPTSGLLLIGKTTDSIIVLNKLFEQKEIQKTYHAICIGKMKRNGEIDLPINGKNAYTQYEVLQTIASPRFGFLNLVKLQPKTGRKHQLRKHLFTIGNPILGDKEYYVDNLILNGKGLYLHASSLVFTHPFTKKNISITKELPKKFKKIFTE